MNKRGQEANASPAPATGPPRSRRRSFVGGGFALLSALCFSTIPIFAKGAYASGLEPLDILSLRFLAAAGLLWAWSLARRVGSLRLSRRDLLSLVVLGAGIYAPMAACFFLSVQRLPASLAEMTLYTYPLLVTVLNVVILHERFTWRRAGLLALGLAGCYLLLDVQATGWDLMGVLWGLAAAFLYALYYTLSHRLVARVEPRISTLYTITFIAMFFAVLRPPWLALTHLDDPLGGWFSVMGLAVVASVLSLQFFYLAVARIGSWRTAIFGVGEPLGAVILAALLLGERLSPGQLAGGALLLGAVLLVQLVE